MANYLVTGAAGFIGRQLADTLLKRGDKVVGIDSFIPYYLPQLKEDRWATLEAQPGFTGIRADLADPESYKAISAMQPDMKFDAIIHLAAQPGVRYARENPLLYIDANLRATTALFEYARHHQKQARIAYASSSSVYGRNTKLPFSEDDDVNRPASLYAATKRSCELLADTYHHLDKLDLVGLRFFTVYGPWGRPDMAAWMFTEAMFNGTPITEFKLASGHVLKRDFTYIDDIVSGIIGIVDMQKGEPQNRLYNLGNNTPVEVPDMIKLLERLTERTANIVEKQAGADEVEATYADITRAQADFGYTPTTDLEAGLGNFVRWYKNYHGL